ncbi:polyubiquitin-tagged protein recognition complex, Npl4 component [Trametopsis cervina]|nr:polyubiquitin-tagged protein recognition complex, Npl4 component [Trametopsis cervina]
MLVRIRSKDGNFRFPLEPNADISELVAKILETTTDADADTIAISNQPRGNETLVSTLRNRTLQSLGIKHGDLLFVSYQSRASPSTSTPAVAPPASTTNGTAAPATHAPKRPWESVQEDPVDTYWRSQDGKIPRGRDSNFCKHGFNAMCDYCMPLEPYDAKYHSEHNIKHLSYHAYINKLSPKGAAAAASASALLPPLEPLDYKVKVPCPSGLHPSWPQGICTKCQPSAITLQSQPFRMVDYLEIASQDIIDRFLHAWRVTGLQRFGWLIGRYAPYDKVPMGVKAVVEAIHEPPQQGELDGLELGLPWEDEPRIRELAQHASAPLGIVGYIFTDLVPRADDVSKTVYKRHPQSFYLSSLEAVFAARVQLANRTASRSSPTGLFASRMVGAVLTGTEDGAVDVRAFQVSEQACAMVDADMIEASVDPGIVRVKEEDRSVDHARYIPDVFFRFKNEYGLEVKQSAKPCFPVEYLMVTISHGFPQDPQPLFRSARLIENRPGMEDQSTERVLRELARLRAPDVQPGSGPSHIRTELAHYLSDWHLVAFLGTTQLVSQKDMRVLLRAASAPDLEDPGVSDELFGTESWQTLVTFAREMAPQQSSGQTVGSSSGHAMDEDIPRELLDQFTREEGGSGGVGAAGGAGAGAGESASRGIRVCPHCTFENSHGGSDCEVCGLPL